MTKITKVRNINSYRKIPGYAPYGINRSGRVINMDTRMPLSIKHREGMNTKRVNLQVKNRKTKSIQRTTRSISYLMDLAFRKARPVASSSY